MVDCPARGGHDDVRTTIEGAQLAADRLATEYRYHLGAELLAVLHDGFADLNGQFAGRRQHQHRWCIREAGLDGVERRECEGSGLTRAGCCLAEHVAAGQQQRDGFALNRCGFFVTKFVERVDEFLAQTECGESPDGWFGLGGCFGNRLRFGVGCGVWRVGRSVGIVRTFEAGHDCVDVIVVRRLIGLVRCGRESCDVDEVGICSLGGVWSRPAAGVVCTHHIAPRRMKQRYGPGRRTVDDARLRWESVCRRRAWRLPVRRRRAVRCLRGTWPHRLRWLRGGGSKRRRP